MLDRLLSAGKRYIFISNIDNLGATIDLNIASLLDKPANGKCAPEFVMEVTNKTAADVKVRLCHSPALCDYIRDYLRGRLYNIII